MKKTITFLILFAILLIAPIVTDTAIAQPPPPPSPEAIPIDGGLGFLLAAGMAYGARKLYKKKGTESESDNL